MRWLVSLSICAALTGCFTAGKRGEKELAVYDLGLPPLRLIEENRKSPIAIEVRAPLWFDALGIEYRLAYADASRLREYGRARWAGPPAQLIQQRLIQQLGFSMAGQGASNCVLRVEITEFSQVFISPENSKGVLQGRAQWLDRSRRQVAERTLNIEKSAPTPDSRGGVSALQATTEQLAIDLLAWEKQLLALGKTGVCPG